MVATLAIIITKGFAPTLELALFRRLDKNTRARYPTKPLPVAALIFFRRTGPFPFPQQTKELYNEHWITYYSARCMDQYRNRNSIQSTSLKTTLGRASKRCPYSWSVVIPEVSLYVLHWDGTLLWAWKFCRYSRIVVISAVVISEGDCTYCYVDGWMWFIGSLFRTRTLFLVHWSRDTVHVL